MRRGGVRAVAHERNVGVCGRDDKGGGLAGSVLYCVYLLVKRTHRSIRDRQGVGSFAKAIHFGISVIHESEMIARRHEMNSSRFRSVFVVYAHAPVQSLLLRGLFFCAWYPVSGSNERGPRAFQFIARRLVIWLHAVLVCYFACYMMRCTGCARDFFKMLARTNKLLHKGVAGSGQD